jgi:hypothetical protein
MAFLLQSRLSYFFPRVSGSLLNKTADMNISKDVFKKGLKLFNDKLVERKARLNFYMVGGGVMALVYGSRESTHDLDGLLQPGGVKNTQVFHEVAAEVAAELNIPADWMNLQVEHIMAEQLWSPSYFEKQPGFTFSNLKVMFAKPGYLLGMKCQVLRKGKKDFSDVVALIKFLNIRTMDELITEVEQYVDSSFIGNDEVPLLKLAIAWAHPGVTQYEPIRQEALNRYKSVKR